MKLRDTLNELKAARAAYHENAPNMTSAQISEETAKIKALNAKVSETLTEGAKNCPDCDSPPVGMFHEGTPNPFEIGCSGTCKNHRVRAALPEDAVDAWNAAEGGEDPDAVIKDEDGNVVAQGFKGYMAPREPGVGIARHVSATGEVLSERTVKIEKPKKRKE